jgi:hypothetical protein
MQRLTFCALLLASACGRVDDATVVRVAQANGIHSVKVGDYATFACGQTESLASSFTGKNAEGLTVTGTVCCRWTTDVCTIRYSGAQRQRSD